MVLYNCHPLRYLTAVILFVLPICYSCWFLMRVLLILQLLMYTTSMYVCNCLTYSIMHTMFERFANETKNLIKNSNHINDINVIKISLWPSSVQRLFLYILWCLSEWALATADARDECKGKQWFPQTFYGRLFLMF